LNLSVFNGLKKAALGATAGMPGSVQCDHEAPLDKLAVALFTIFNSYSVVPSSADSNEKLI
jgi:hypothetical protein